MDTNKNQNSDEQFIVVITGAAGNIGSILSFMLAEKNLFNCKGELILRLIDIPMMKTKLQGIALEIEDCNFALSVKVEVVDESPESFSNAHCVILIGGKPRLTGMSRMDLLKDNAEIFKSQAIMCEKGAVHPFCKVIIVANPCNTNALIFSEFIKIIPKSNITSLSMLDQLRAKKMIGNKLQKNGNDLKNVFIYGNHSNTMFVDISKAFLKKTEVSSLLDEHWIKTEFQQNVQNRGSEILNTKGSSSVYSTAIAIVEHLRVLYNGSNEENVSIGVITDFFGTELCVSIPTEINNKLEIVPKAFFYKELSQTSQTCILNSIKELEEEKKIAFDFLDLKNN